MAALDKLSIMGIRSFSPREEQVIQFYTPLTLILGPNGTGKTSIIESLRYVTTGEMPPNCLRSGAFIHDPKIAKEVEVKAGVKLKFSSIQNKPVTINRLCRVVQKQKNITFNSLDGTIKSINDEGKPVSISSKCADLNREMVSYLGVSKAIINNVIFCHQEDSNWPLADAKTLKEKFDEIFAATRYIKALDNIQAIRLDHDKRLKLCETELKYLEADKQQVMAWQKDIESLETRLMVSVDNVKSIDEKLQPIVARIKELVKKESKIQDIETNLARKETELRMEDKACQDLAKLIVEMFTGTTAELEQQLRSFARQLKDKKSEKEDVNQSLIHLEADKKKLTAKRSDMLIRLGKLQTEMELHKEKVKKRDTLARATCEKYQLTVTLGSGQLTKEKIELIERELEQKLEQIQQDQRLLKNDFLDREKSIQDKLNALRESKTKFETMKSTKNQQILDNQREIRLINDKLIEVEASASRLKIIESELKRKERELQSALGELDALALQAEIGDLEKKKSTLDQQIRKLDTEMMNLHTQAKGQAELELARKEKTTKEEAIKKLKSKHDDSLKHLLESVPTENFCSAVDRLNSHLSRAISDLRDCRDKLVSRKATCESDRKSKMKELQRKEAELRESEEKLFQACGSKNLESVLKTSQNLITNLQEESGSVAGTRFLYGKFLDKLQQAEPCCPLCHRDFPDRQDVDELVNEINNKLRLSPSEVDAKKKALAVQQEKHHELLLMRQVEKTKNSLADKEIPELRLKIKALEGETEKIRTELSEVDEIMMFKQVDESTIKGMHSDMNLIDQNISDLKKVERRIVEATKLVGGDSVRPLAEVNKEKMDLQKKSDELHGIFKKKQQKLGDYQERTQALQAEVNKLGAEQVQVSRDVQTVTQLENSKVELGNSNAALRRDIDEIKTSLMPFENDIKNLEKEKEEVVIQKEQALEEARKSHTEVKNTKGNIVSYHADVTKFLDKQMPEHLQKCEKELGEVDANLKKGEGKEQSLFAQIQLLDEELSRLQTNGRNLVDNKNYREKKEVVDAVKEEVANLRNSLGGLDRNSLQTEKVKLQKKEKEYESERNKAVGQRGELEESIRKLRVDLQVPKYRDAEKNHKEKLIEATVTRVASSDLRKYSAALDTAIMQYHTQKMNTINKIVAELWAKTYKGTDVDYIAIKSDFEEVQNNTKVNRRKKYVYRVVMGKGDVEYDMRGRCSAGQKVLASLIIRLALAETFCLNCNILALDEPTTNLDHDNILGLAEALSDLLKMRSEHNNFQLIVITHDEDFVERLGRAEFVDYYWKVGKNDSGHSCLTKWHVRSLP